MKDWDHLYLCVFKSYPVLLSMLVSLGQADVQPTDNTCTRNIFLLSCQDAGSALGDASAVPNSAPCVVLSELLGCSGEQAVHWSVPLLGLSVGACWELIFSSFFSGMLKPSESPVATFAVVGFWTSVKNKFKNIFLFTMKNEASEITGQLLKMESTRLRTSNQLSYVPECWEAISVTCIPSYRNAVGNIFYN